MKKLVFVAVLFCATVFSSCGKINDELDALDERLDQLEKVVIPSIDEQIDAINTTLGSLDAMDKELKGYIDNLTTTASSLQEQINATNTNIDEVEAALQGEISTAKSEVLSQLNAVKAELEGELSQINATIDTLKAKDTELDKKIAELRSYVDTELGETTDWVNATFATLEQYNALVSEVATIKEHIKAINQSIADLETRLTTKINEDIASATSSLNAELQQQVKDITDAYTEAVKSAKEDITKAYTSAIQSAISTLDSSLKAWVGEQLSNYYTIAEIDAKMAAVNGQIEAGDEALAEELSALKSSLEAAKKELTEAYEKAIEQAIEEYNGEIAATIASEINSVNQRINEEVAAINSKLATLQSQVDKNSANISKLLARIQSLSYIPQYDDGKATVKFADETSLVTLDFEVSPKDAVAELAKVWQDALSVKAVYTKTRAVSFVDMPIVKFEADTDNGVISVTASGENLSAEFFAGTQPASARLAISDGNSAVTTDYISMVAKEVLSKELGMEIWYTTSNNKIIEPSSVAFDANIVSYTYENGQGIIFFDKPITSIGAQAFEGCSSLTSITIPDSVTSIGGQSFEGCSSLTSITIPDSVTSIGKYAFAGCSSLTSITIPDSVTEIGYEAFVGCTSLPIENNIRYADTYVVGAVGQPLSTYTLKDGVRFIGDFAFYSCTSLTSITIPDSVTEIGQQAFCNCRSLTNITIPDSVTSIEDAAFSICTSLTSVTIGNGITEIGREAFYGCSSLTEVYCKATTPPTKGDKMFDNNASGRKIYVPRASVDAYKAAEYWSDYADDIVGYNF